jgi:hypothetical protein
MAEPTSLMLGCTSGDKGPHRLGPHGPNMGPTWNPSYDWFHIQGHTPWILAHSKQKFLKWNGWINLRLFITYKNVRKFIHTLFIAKLKTVIYFLDDARCSIPPRWVNGWSGWYIHFGDMFQDYNQNNGTTDGNSLWDITGWILNISKF